MKNTKPRLLPATGWVVAHPYNPGARTAGIFGPKGRAWANITVYRTRAEAKAHYGCQGKRATEPKSFWCKTLEKRLFRLDLRERRT